MRCFIIALFVVGFGFAAIAQTNPPLASPPPAAPSAVTAPEPASPTTPDNAPYLDKPALLTACQAQLTAFSDKPCDIIFIGDSITADWLTTGKAIWDKSYAPRHALNFGVSGDKTQNVLWRLNNMEIQDLKPKVAVILIGKNNVASSPHEIADGVKAVLANTQAAFPGVKIILVSIMPNENDHDKLMQANSIIKSLANDSSIYYLDLASLMTATITTGADGQTDTNWKGLSKDHIHPDASGYQIWADAMEPLLTKLLAGG